MLTLQVMAAILLEDEHIVRVKGAQVFTADSALYQFSSINALSEPHNPDDDAEPFVAAALPPPAISTDLARTLVCMVFKSFHYLYSFIFDKSFFIYRNTR